jgi:hypothetical protein
MIERNIWPVCEKNLERKEILLIIGARQTGKTTLLLRIQEHLASKGSQVHYFTLEDPHLLAQLNSHPEQIFNYIPKNEAKSYLLLDEVQYLEHPSSFLKYLYDTHGRQLKLIVSGSSAFYIDRNFTDSLEGRKRILELYPFSFSEFLKTKKEHDLAEEIRQHTWLRTGAKRKLLVPQKQKLIQYLVEYLKYGGYPGVVTESDPEEKRLILKDLHESFLKKDILESGVTQEYKFYQMVKIIASSSGALLNANEIANTIGLAADTVREYLHILRKSFIIDLLSPFHSNVRKELTKMPKAYLLDMGFRNTVLNDFKLPSDRLDKGALLENMVFIALRTYGIEPLHFWRTQDKKEVDFVIPGRIALETKWQASSFKAKKYEKFTTAYPEIPLEPICYQDSEHLELLDILH